MIGPTKYEMIRTVAITAIVVGAAAVVWVGLFYLVARAVVGVLIG